MVNCGGVPHQNHSDRQVQRRVDAGHTEDVDLGKPPTRGLGNDGAKWCFQ